MAVALCLIRPFIPVRSQAPSAQPSWPSPELVAPEHTCTPGALAQGSCRPWVKNISGEALGGPASTGFAAWTFTERTLDILAGGQFLAKLMAISGVVEMARCPVVTPAVAGPRAGGNCWAPCPCLEAAGAGGLALQSFSCGSALHLTLSLCRRISALCSQAQVNPFFLSYEKLGLQWDVGNSCKSLHDTFQAVVEQRQKVSLNHCYRHTLQFPVFGRRERYSALDKSKALCLSRFDFSEWSNV